jgi:hypothetical protein
VCAVQLALCVSQFASGSEEHQFASGSEEFFVLVCQPIFFVGFSLFVAAAVKLRKLFFSFLFSCSAHRSRSGLYFRFSFQRWIFCCRAHRDLPPVLFVSAAQFTSADFFVSHRFCCAPVDLGAAASPAAGARFGRRFSAACARQPILSHPCSSASNRTCPWRCPVSAPRN